jgi:hypothetical protein
MALTRRGRRVRSVVRFAFWLAVFWLAFWVMDYLTTPDECRVAVEEMSQFCIDLIYP